MTVQLLKQDVVALEHLAGGKLIHLRQRVNNIVRHNQNRFKRKLHGGNDTPDSSPKELTRKEQQTLGHAIGEFCKDTSYSISAQTRFNRYMGMGDLLSVFAHMSDATIPSICHEDKSFQAFLQLIRTMEKHRKTFQHTLVDIMENILDMMDNGVCKGNSLTQEDVEGFHSRLQQLSATFEPYSMDFMKTMSLQDHNFNTVGQWQGLCLEEINKKLQEEEVYKELDEKYGEDTNRRISCTSAQEYYKVGAFTLLTRTAMPFSGHPMDILSTLLPKTAIPFSGDLMAILSMPNPVPKYQIILIVVATINNLAYSLNLHQ